MDYYTTDLKPTSKSAHTSSGEFNDNELTSPFEEPQLLSEYSVFHAFDESASATPIHWCHLCANNGIVENIGNAKSTRIDSGVGNVSDWVHIFTYEYSYDDGYGSLMKEFEFYYCNLNNASEHFRKFARNCYVDMSGTDFDIIPETSIDMVIKKHCKIRIEPTSASIQKSSSIGDCGWNDWAWLECI